MARPGKASKREQEKNETRGEEKKEEKKAPQKKQKGIKGIIRIAGRDVYGEVPLNQAILRVRGIGYTSGNAMSGIIAEKFSIPANIEVGDLTQEQLGQLDKILLNMQDYLPTYLMNRRKDPFDGKDKHVITNDLIFSVRQDIEKEKKLYSWKGYRHAYGQKVRGQKTRNTGRIGMAVGVLRKTILAAAQQQKAAEKGGAPGAPAPAAVPGAKSAAPAPAKSAAQSAKEKK